MPENSVVEQAIEPCRVCGSMELNLNCPNCREILLVSGQAFDVCATPAKPPLQETSGN